MSTCSIQNGGKRRGGKRSRGKKSYRGGNPDVPAYNPTTPTPVPTSAPAPAPAGENNGVLAGLASGFSSFTKTVGNSLKNGVSAIRASQPHPDQATLAPSTSSAQQGGRRRKKTKTMRKSKKARRFKHKRSRKSKH
jgi:hypothetical protein